MLQNFIHQVGHNCQHSSGAQAGLFSLCGLLLRLRQLYKWEHELLPWQEPESAEVLDWIAAQESAWDALEDEAWDQLRWNGRTLNPFAVEDINLLLRLTVDETTFLRYVHQDPSLAYQLLKMMSKRVRTLSAEVTHLTVNRLHEDNNMQINSPTQSM